MSDIREACFGFAIRNNLISNLVEVPYDISDGLMILRLPFHGDRYATIISAYAPTIPTEEADKLAFFKELRFFQSSQQSYGN